MQLREMKNRSLKRYCCAGFGNLNNVQWTNIHGRYERLNATGRTRWRSSCGIVHRSFEAALSLSLRLGFFFGIFQLSSVTSDGIFDVVVGPVGVSRCRRWHVVVGYARFFRYGFEISRLLYCFVGVVSDFWNVKRLLLLPIAWEGVGILRKSPRGVGCLQPCRNWRE